jgi:pentapeptide repeat protein
MTKLQQARPAITWALVAFAILVAFAALILVPAWLEPPLSKADLSTVPAGEKRVTLQQAQAQLQNSSRSTLLQGLAGVLVIAGAVATWRQVQISREGQITDRLTHAIDQLGNDKVDVRIGGIYALERLAKDSAADRLALVEILAAFIRTHAAWPAGHWSHPDPHPTLDVDETMLWLTDRAPDVRTAVLVLGRYPHEQREHRLPLRRVDLRRTNFYHGTLIKVDLGDSNLAASAAAGVHWERCRFWNTDLRKTQLKGATLDHSEFNGAHLHGANLAGASLREANLSDASLRGANLRDADLRGANLTRADLSGADLSGARLLGAQLDDIQDDHATTWPAGTA